MLKFICGINCVVIFSVYRLPRQNNKVYPKLFGGRAAKSPVEGLGVEVPAQAVCLKNTTVTMVGGDFLLEGDVDTDVYGNR